MDFIKKIRKTRRSKTDIQQNEGKGGDILHDVQISEQLVAGQSKPILYEPFFNVIPENLSSSSLNTEPEIMPVSDLKQSTLVGEKQCDLKEMSKSRPVLLQELQVLLDELLESEYNEKSKDTENIFKELTENIQNRLEYLRLKDLVLHREQKKLVHLQNELTATIRQISLTDRKIAAVRNEQNNRQAELAMLLEKDVSRFEAEVKYREPVFYEEYERISTMKTNSDEAHILLSLIRRKLSAFKKLELLLYRKLAMIEHAARTNTAIPGVGMVSTLTSAIVPTGPQIRKFEFNFPNTWSTGVLAGQTAEERYKYIVESLAENSRTQPEKDNVYFQGMEQVEENSEEEEQLMVPLMLETTL